MAQHDPPGRRSRSASRGIVWYYHALADAFRNRTPIALWQQLEDTVSALEAR